MSWKRWTKSFRSTLIGLLTTLLAGGADIADFLGCNTREVYHLAKTGRLPIGRLGRKLIASRNQLRRAAKTITAA